MYVVSRYQVIIKPIIRSIILYINERYSVITEPYKLISHWILRNRNDKQLSRQIYCYLDFSKLFLFNKFAFHEIFYNFLKELVVLISAIQKHSNVVIQTIFSPKTMTKFIDNYFVICDKVIIIIIGTTLI